jgi:branched-chain amino acid transport system permease protein
MHGLRALVDTIARHRVAAVIVFLMVFPWLMPYHALAVNIVIFGLYAVGFNILFGYTGLLSFGHAAFLGTGSYGTGMVMVHLGWPWYVALPVGVAAATAIGVVIYFAMVTLALSQCVYYIFYKAERYTGGENGLRGIKVGALEAFGWRLDFLDPTVKYYVVLAFVALALWFVSRVLGSPFGAVLETVRENDRRAQACGYDVARSKLLAFVISAALCGLAGGLRALHLSIVPIDSLHYLTSGVVVMMCLLGGMGTFFGPFVGAAALLLIEEGFTNLTRHWQLVTGIVFMGCVLFFPRGIWGSILHWLRVK